MNFATRCFGLLGLMTTIAAAGSPKLVQEKRSLTLDGAKVVVESIRTEAGRVGAPGASVAVVDDGGNLVLLERLDGTFAAAWRVSIGKARTAVMFAKPTSFFEKVIKDGRTPMLALDDFTPLQGGIPIVVEGQVVGAVGVSGASSAQQDEELASVGAAAVGTSLARPADASRAKVIHLDGESVDAAFAVGKTLVRDDANRFVVNASRRDAPGVAEVHVEDTDIFHILNGSATFVTGGALSTSTAGPESSEVRGVAIDGGEECQVSTGDVVVVPKGTPHWFRDIHSPLTYYVVKVR